MESYEKGTIQSPFMTLLDSDVQQIMNELWEAGVRHSRVVERYWMTAYERIADELLSSAALLRQGG